jgi:hypothetical protein
MTPTLTATRGTVYEDTLEQDNADILSSRLNDIGDPTKWITGEEFNRRANIFLESVGSKVRFQ